MLGSTKLVTYAAMMASTMSTLCNGHFFISTPTPIQGSAPKDPLDPSGSNFPCHGIALPSSGGQKMAAGSSQALTFDLGGGQNTAVHGGGSCQLSLLYDTTKAKDPSAWHVIYSIEGGCPANIEGNFPSGKAIDCTSQDQGDCVHSFNYTIPQGVESGNAILSWTWFNTVGNREIYQNCAAVDITGGTGTEMSDLPAMFVANIPSVVSDCATSERTAVAFPQPGKYVIQQTATNGYSFPLGTPAACAGGGAAASPTGYGSSDPTPEATGASSVYAVPSSSASALPTGTPSDSVPADSTPAAYQTQSAVMATTFATTYATVTASASESASAPSSPVKASNPKSEGSSGTPCSNEGGIVCIDDTHFGICNWGSAVPQSLAAGTTCANGVVSKRHISRHAAKHAAHVAQVHKL